MDYNMKFPISIALLVLRCFVLHEIEQEACGCDMDERFWGCGGEK
jgi:hypothetical protein